MTTALLLALAVLTQDASGRPVELGRVDWERDHEAAFSRAEREERPVFLLFQEIPGCQTCQSFGQGPLSHSLLVEAIETEFVPLAIYNNRGGTDATVLKSYREPSWNNPVVRFFGADRNELLPRKDRVWTAEGIAARMVASLEKAEREVPLYLRLAYEELGGDRIERAVFAMHCFWKGEAVLGRQPGVTRTRAAWLDGREVVEVYFDPDLITYERLVRAAGSMQCADRVYATTGEQLETARELVGNRAERNTDRPRNAKESDRKFHLRRRTALNLLPLTPLQATRVNAAVEAGEDPSGYLSPRQRELRAMIEKALQADSGILDGLQRPESLGELAAYDARIRKRIRESVE